MRDNIKLWWFLTPRTKKNPIQLKPEQEIINLLVQLYESNRIIDGVAGKEIESQESS